jgi:hypothetical protein
MRVLANRNVRLYLGGVLVSGFGDSAMSLVAGVWVKTLTGSNSLAALVGFGVWLPLLIGPVIGGLADRLPRRRLLVATNLALSLVLVGPLAVRSPGDIWLLFVTLLLVGIGGVLIDATEVALVTSAIPADLRPDLNGLVRSAIESMKLVAPAAGVGLFAALGGRAVAVLDAATFAVAALLFARLQGAPASPTTTTKTKGRLPRRARPLVIAGGVALVASTFASTATFAMLDALHRAPTFVGLLTPVQGIGSIVSGVATGAILRRRSEWWFASVGLALFAVGVLAHATPWVPAVVAGTFAIGLGLPCPIVAAITLVQRATPDAVLGRVAATASTAMFAPAGPALLVGSGAVGLFDYRIQTVVGAGLATAAAIATAGAAGSQAVDNLPAEPRAGDPAAAEQTLPPASGTSRAPSA